METTPGGGRVAGDAVEGTGEVGLVGEASGGGERGQRDGRKGEQLAGHEENP
jgi:hypothetical protein